MMLDRLTDAQQQSFARGRALAAVGITVAVMAAAVLVTAVLLGLDYDFEDGILDPFEPAWTPMALVLAAVAGSWVLLAARPWMRWVVGTAGILGAGWVLLGADFGDAPLWAAIVLAVAWAAAGLLVTVPRSVGDYLTHRPDGFVRLLGPLDGEAAARRWFAAMAAWEGAGVLSNRERRRLVAELAAWAAAATPSPDLARAIAAVAPAHRDPGFVRRLVDRWRRRGLVQGTTDPVG